MCFILGRRGKLKESTTHFNNRRFQLLLFFSVRFTPHSFLVLAHKTRTTASAQKWQIIRAYRTQNNEALELERKTNENAEKSDSRKDFKFTFIYFFCSVITEKSSPGLRFSFPLLICLRVKQRASRRLLFYRSAVGTPGILPPIKYLGHISVVDKSHIDMWLSMAKAGGVWSRETIGTHKRQRTFANLFFFLLCRTHCLLPVSKRPLIDINADFHSRCALPFFLNNLWPLISPSSQLFNSLYSR